MVKEPLEQKETRSQSQGGRAWDLTASERLLCLELSHLILMLPPETEELGSEPRADSGAGCPPTFVHAASQSSGGRSAVSVHYSRVVYWGYLGTVFSSEASNHPTFFRSQLLL